MSAMAKKMSPSIGQIRVVDSARRIVEVSWVKGSRAGRSDIVSLSPLIDTLKFYAPLRKNSEIFETVRLIDDGYAIAWVNGSIDMSAASVERLAEEAMSGEDFNAFLRRNALTHQAAAAALGRSKRQIEHYLQYETLPRMVVLACIGYETRKCAEATVISGRGITIHSDGIIGATLDYGFNRTIKAGGLMACYHASFDGQIHGWTVPDLSAAVTAKQKQGS